MTLLSIVFIITIYYSFSSAIPIIIEGLAVAFFYCHHLIAIRASARALVISAGIATPVSALRVTYQSVDARYDRLEVLIGSCFLVAISSAVG